ncbi:hypothetical protein DMC15_03490 [Vibrio sp. 11986-1-5]|nr:hypothetical protein CEQ50_08600 [Vibrio anguillarum]MDQ2194486.1 hypothetical protein [Vibrio sp. A14(2019)]MDQ2196729.1 hypothetical protein [Vibrio sp. 2017_1457_11]NNN75946.1 hypothetical protein [Vibrio sp. B7]NNN92511.1 hypothetical protein [Vibrio sp. B8-1]NNO08036.1 hypothetical protein [Vibrio sp. B4-12]PXA73987.1 hypothetical protein DMC15_03490 [Vibrio sp. 11986-1-5]
MSRLLRYEKKSSSSLHEPDWLASATPLQKMLYLEAKKQFDAKKAAIESGQTSEGKDRKIVASEVASAAKCDKSNISKRKNPDLHKWITDHTEQLIALAQVKRQSTVSRRKTAEEVRKENQLIKNQIKTDRNHDYVAIAEALLGCTLIESHKNLSDELAELRHENQTLQNQVAELRETNRQLIKSINISSKKHGI